MMAKRLGAPSRHLLNLFGTLFLFGIENEADALGALERSAHLTDAVAWTAKVAVGETAVRAFWARRHAPAPAMGPAASCHPGSYG